MHKENGMNIKRKHILFVVAVALTLACYRTWSNLPFKNAASYKVYTSVSEYIKAYKEHKECLIDFDHVLEELGVFLTNQKNVLGQQDNWLAGVMPGDAWFSYNAFTLSHDYKNSNQFFPYTQKKIFSDTAQFAVWGDLHGSVETVVSSLCYLQDQGYLDENFKIISDNLYCVFLGDFCDKEPHGLELIYLIIKFCNLNPGRVFLLRGNHEDAAVNKTFRKELQKKYPDISTVRRNKLFCLYDHLPVALFAGIPSSQKIINGIQFCHAGFEHGYSAKNLLNSPADCELITHLPRRSILDQLPKSATLQSYKKLEQMVDAAVSHTDKALEKMLVQEAKMEQVVINGYHWLFVELLAWWHTHELVQALPTLFQDISLTPSTNLGDIRLGFSWNSFTHQENNKRLKNRDDLHILWSYAHFNMGPEALNYFLKINSTDTWNVGMVVRGHQHQGLMLEDLKKGKGLASWFDGKLLTTVASPLLTGYHSFVMLETYPEKSEWAVTRYARLPKMSSQKAVAWLIDKHKIFTE